MESRCTVWESLIKEGYCCPRGGAMMINWNDFWNYGLHYEERCWQWSITIGNLGILGPNKDIWVQKDKCSLSLKAFLNTSSHDGTGMLQAQQNF